MQRISFWFFLVAALYVSGLAYATDAAPAASAVTVQPVPHIALLLPLKSAIFGRAAEVVRQGFLSAASLQPQTLPVRVYECADENTDIIALYQQAIAGGARAVAGPLTRNGVAVLANYSGITVPTLALNLAEGKGADKLYFFGLTAEMEARQIAQLAASAGLHSASIVSSGTPLSKRLSQAFAEEWKIHGGNIAKKILYQDNPAVLADLPAMEGNMVFLAANAETAHLIRPYLDNVLPVYATSQLFNGNTDTLTNFDLNDVRFIDMPWLLQPDHPAVMIYPRANPPLEPDMERLYALGIDAFRLLQIMLDNSYRTSLPLDGVTGRIRLNVNRQFQREAIPAQFWQGRGLTSEEVAAQEAALAAARAAAASGILPASAPAAAPTGRTSDYP
jgi:outer membrane PBP1 activator LpoA protein